MNLLLRIFSIIPFFYSIGLTQDFSKIDKDLSDFNFNKTLITLEELNNSYPNNEDILLRLSITHHYLSEQSIEKKEDKENAQKAYKYIVQAYNLNPEDPNILKWYVIALGKTVEEESIRRQIEQSKNIENLSLKVIEMMPDDEFCYTIMGQWHYKLASLGKASRRIASILFSEPPQGTFDQAIYFLDKSLELNADYIGTYYWLGKVHLKLGNKQKAYELFNKGILLDRPFKREEKLFQDMNKIIERNN